MTDRRSVHEATDAAEMLAPMSVRRLGPADVTRLHGLNALFGDAFDDPGTYQGAPPTDTYLTELLAKENVLVLVAIAGTAVVGGLVAYEFEKFEQRRREFYIYDLAVASEYRRRGVATTLIGHLKEIALERGVWAVFVQADHGDEPAIALYESLGVRQEVLHFDINL
ncbi:AAC(3)-I family aminoglycoside N-acetyltransferase [Sphingopyxis sp.]|uniref:AAC(3)-I family aminoglycoside N-acetyltransferase n=1 Tax=Sphingopyxis sp. TaxID=1908224 RepID=UPI003F719F20